jgi:hypothetical protein
MLFTSFSKKTYFTAMNSLKGLKLLGLGAMCMAALSTASCLDLSGDNVLTDYSNCFTYVYDNATGTDHIDTNASYRVIGDVSAYTYTLEINNLSVADGSTLRSAKLSNLSQYYSTDSTYIYIMQRGTTYTTGELDVTNLRWGQIGNYWLTFNTDDDRYTANVVPRKYNVVADTTIVSTKRGIYVEAAIEPVYHVALDPDTETATITAVGAKFPTSTEVSGTLMFMEMEWRNLPVKFNTTGYTIDIDSFVPYINGELNSEYTITNFHANIDLTYEGEKVCTYRLGEVGNIKSIFYSWTMGQ